ncbi:MAG: hypothetical protein JJ913_18570 [Rhizobiaceae bacterium]|nr:hypothetical protein [Rhizobiaceae bacterium]
MLRNSKLLTRAAPALIGLAIAGAAYASGGSDGNQGSSLCEIKASASGSMVSLSGVFVADGAISGSYRFQVTSVGGSGNTNIRQGGGFSAGAGEEVTLGSVMLGGYGAQYDASLEITAGGETFTCSERVGASI